MKSLGSLGEMVCFTRGLFVFDNLARMHAMKTRILTRARTANACLQNHVAMTMMSPCMLTWKPKLSSSGYQNLCACLNLRYSRCTITCHEAINYCSLHPSCYPNPGASVEQPLQTTKRELTEAARLHARRTGFHERVVLFRRERSLVFDSAMLQILLRVLQQAASTKPAMLSYCRALC